MDRAGSGKPHRFHHISTDEVYGTLGGPGDPPFIETHAIRPDFTLAPHRRLRPTIWSRAYHHTYGLQVTTSNCSKNYGPYQFPEKLIPLFLLNALHGKKLPIYGDGQQIRDWLYVEDHCRGIELVIDKGRVGETYNIGGGAELPNLSVIDILCSSVDAAFAAVPELAHRFPDGARPRGRPTASLKSFVRDGRATTGAMRSTRPRSARSLDMRPPVPSGNIFRRR